MASNSSNPSNKIIAQFHISPPPGAVPDSTSIPLSFFDVAWLFTGPVERLFFYALPMISTSDFLSVHLPPLRSGLSETLRQFYPLAGRVHPTPNNQFEFYSCSNDIIPLTLTECSSDFDKLTGNGIKDFAELYSLVPELLRTNDGTIPLTSIQVTVFPGKGVCIGVAMHHVACDDSSFLHFVKSWAAAVSRVKEPGNTCELIPPPQFDRRILSDPNNLYAKTLSEMKEMMAKGPPPPSDPPLNPSRPLIATFVLSRDQIGALKAGLITKSNDPQLHCSSFTVACAYAWVCLIKSQQSTTPNGTIASKSAHLLFSVECRARLDPPLPTEFFGNCLRPCFVAADSHALSSPGGVYAAAMAIGRSIKELQDGVLKGAEEWFRKIVSLVPTRPMSVGGSPRYKVYDIGFGWGKPVKVELPTIEKTPGTVSLAEGREGNGGIEIGVVLPEHEMVRFASCFNNGFLDI